jgi:hypothetical protein
MMTTQSTPCGNAALHIGTYALSHPASATLSQDSRILKLTLIFEARPNVFGGHPNKIHLR